MLSAPPHWEISLPQLYLEKIVELILVPHQVGQVRDKAEAFLIGSLVVCIIGVHAW